MMFIELKHMFLTVLNTQNSLVVEPKQIIKICLQIGQQKADRLLLDSFWRESLFWRQN